MWKSRAQLVFQCFYKLIMHRHVKRSLVNTNQLTEGLRFLVILIDSGPSNIIPGASAVVGKNHRKNEKRRQKVGNGYSSYLLIERSDGARRIGCRTHSYSLSTTT